MNGLPRKQTPSHRLDLNPFRVAVGRSRGRGNQKDTGLRDKSDADVAKGDRDRSLPKAERQRYKKEEKARGERNRKKREDK